MGRRPGPCQAQPGGGAAAQSLCRKLLSCRSCSCHATNLPTNQPPAKTPQEPTRVVNPRVHGAPAQLQHAAAAHDDVGVRRAGLPDQLRGVPGLDQQRHALLRVDGGVLDRAGRHLPGSCFGVWGSGRGGAGRRLREAAVRQGMREVVAAARPPPRASADGMQRAAHAPIAPRQHPRTPRDQRRECQKQEHLRAGQGGVRAIAFWRTRTAAAVAPRPRPF